jgi:hypothetical protein
MTEENICEYCNKKSSSVYNLQRHQKTCKEMKNNEIDRLNNLVIELNNKIQEDQYLKNSLEKEVHYLKNLYSELLCRFEHSKTINNNYSSTISSTNNFTLKQIVSKLEPISFDDIKNSMSQLTNEYIDEGIKGFAKFLCDHGCNNKIITTDSSRSTIAYRTAYDDFIRDPECINLINNTLQKNSDEIIKKTDERKDYYRTLMDKNTDTQEYINISNKASKIFELKRLTESSIREKPDDNIKKIFNILVNHGLTTYHKISNTTST